MLNPNMSSLVNNISTSDAYHSHQHDNNNSSQANSRVLHQGGGLHQNAPQSYPPIQNYSYNNHNGD